jgi:cytochrome-b5 reductase
MMDGCCFNLKMLVILECSGPFNNGVPLHGSCRSSVHVDAGMIAGGSGITPMYQIAKEIVSNRQDTTKVSIVFANLSINDILLRTELDELARSHPEQIHLHYVLDAAPPGWSGSTGYVTADVIKKHCPSPGSDGMLLFCGPRPMTEALKRTAKEMGYAQDHWHEF